MNSYYTKNTNAQGPTNLDELQSIAYYAQM
jgi:hypothetical protein